MFGLDALAGGGALGMLPGANVLSLVTKGLEIIKDLIEQGNTKGADAVLGFLNDVLNETTAKDTGSAAEPQPFTPPQQNANGAPLNFEVSFTPPSGKPVSHGGLPIVDGSPAGDRRLTDAARDLMVGSEGSKDRALKPGSQEWTAIMWAMQGQENVRYDADTSRFFTQLSDGSKLDVCSLQDVQDVIEGQFGGYSRNEPYAPAAVGDYMKEKVGVAHRLPMTATVTLSIMYANRPPADGGQPGNVDDINSKIDELKRRLQEYEAARQVMQTTANVTMTVGR
jgi:hypothetical protein